MFYRLSGTYHTSYAADRKLWKIPADRWQIAIVFVLLLVPLFVSPLYLGSYLLGSANGAYLGAGFNIREYFLVWPFRHARS